MKLPTGLTFRIGVLLLAAGTLRCSGEGPVVPPEASAIAKVAGDGQNGVVGTMLPDLLIVRVTDEEGAPVAGVPVEWEAGGDGTVSDATVETGEDGTAGVQRT